MKSLGHLTSSQMKRLFKEEAGYVVDDVFVRLFVQWLESGCGQEETYFSLEELQETNRLSRYMRLYCECFA